MGIAANKFRLLFLTASKSDIEYEISKLNQERIKLMDQAQLLAANHAGSIFQSGEHTWLHNGNLPGALPGIIGNPNVNQNSIPEGEYEAQLLVIQSMDEKLEVEVKKQETFLLAKRTEVEAIEKLLDKNIEKEYKTFNG